MIHRYTVLDGSREPDRVILRHDRGDYHLASHVTEAPPYGTRLEGSAPEVGIQVLVSLATSRIYRLRFLSIDLDVGVRALETPTVR
jgi:hypothetical protein